MFSWLLSARGGLRRFRIQTALAGMLIVIEPIVGQRAIGSSNNAWLEPAKNDGPVDASEFDIELHICRRSVGRDRSIARRLFQKLGGEYLPRGCRSLSLPGQSGFPLEEPGPTSSLDPPRVNRTSS